MRPKLLTKHDSEAPVVEPPNGQRSSHQVDVDLLFMSEAEEGVSIAQAIEEDDRGESIPYEQSRAELKAFSEELAAEARRKMLSR